MFSVGLFALLACFVKHLVVGHVSTTSLPAINPISSYHCAMELTLRLDTNYISIRAMVNDAEQAQKSGSGYVNIRLDRATQALEECNVENPTLFATYDAFSRDTTRVRYNSVIFRWSFDNSSSPSTRIFHLAVSTKDIERPFASHSINLNYFPKQEMRFQLDSVQLDNKVSYLKSPECNFVATHENKTLHQLFIEFYVPQPIVDCGLKLLFPTGFVRTDEMFDDQHGNLADPIAPKEYKDDVVVNISQSIFGSAFGPHNGRSKASGESSMLVANHFVLMLTFVLSILTICL